MLAPGVETAFERADPGDAAASEEERHTGARSFVWSSTVEDDFAVVRESLIVILEFLCIHAESAGNGFGIGLKIHRVTKIDDHEILAGVELVFQFFDGDASDAQVAQKASAGDEFIGEIGSEGTKNNDTEAAAERGGVFRDILNLSTEDVTHAEESGGPKRCAQGVEYQKTAGAHVEDSGERRGDGAETGKKFRNDQRVGALLRENALGAANAGVRFDRYFAEKMENFDASVAAKLVPKGIGRDGGKRDDREREKKVHLMGAGKRTCGKQERKRRNGHSCLLKEDPSEQDDVAMMEEEFYGAVHLAGQDPL
jgi:hypothetical protein